MAMQRREFFNLGALLAGGALLTSRVAFARTDERRARLVLIIMRGALDGLAAVPPYGDGDYAALRGEFALRAPEDARARIADVSAGDPLLSARFADALAADAIASADGAGSLAAMAPDTAPRAMSAAGTLQPARPAQANGARYAQVVRAAAGFLRQAAGPRVAMFDTTGWDTHANEGAAAGQLAGRLSALDSGLATLRQELGPVWSDTAVLPVTEFCRTAAINGPRGTDHGTATVALLVGGAVAGGRVIADWPGLSARALDQGRGPAPTLDLRSVLKGVLQEHLLVPPRQLEHTVFPDSRTARPLTGLVRT